MNTLAFDAGPSCFLFCEASHKTGKVGPGQPLSTRMQTAMKDLDTVAPFSKFDGHGDDMLALDVIPPPKQRWGESASSVEDPSVETDFKDQDDSDKGRAAQDDCIQSLAVSLTDKLARVSASGVTRERRNDIASNIASTDSGPGTGSGAPGIRRSGSGVGQICRTASPGLRHGISRTGSGAGSSPVQRTKVLTSRTNSISPMRSPVHSVNTSSRVRSPIRKRHVQVAHGCACQRPCFFLLREKLLLHSCEQLK